MRPVTRDSFPHLMACLLDRLRIYVNTLISRWLAAWWKINLGQSCRFAGLTVFRRIPSSTIKVGARCKFLSTNWANFSGINHPCILVTLKEGAMITIGDDCGFSGVSIAAGSSVISRPLKTG